MISPFFTSAIALAYAGVGVVSAIGYAPTIKDLVVHKRSSANVASYVIWTGTSAVAFLYSVFVLPDALFQFVSGVNVVCCAAIAVLSWRLQGARVADTPNAVRPAALASSAAHRARRRAR